MKIFLYLLICLYCCSCSNSVNDRQKSQINASESKASKGDTVILTDSDSLISEFDTSVFSLKLNAYLHSIPGNKKNAVCKSDTGLISDKSNNRFAEWLTTEKTAIRHFRFDLGDKYYKNLEVYYARYSDSKSCNLAFMRLKDKKGNRSPVCLSKVNEYVLKTDKSIYWLSGACYYPYDKFSVISYLFETSLRDILVRDSVKCKCGGWDVSSR